MRVKTIPEDFRVVELARCPLGPGRFACYRLTKRNLGTLEALDAIARSWNLPRRRLQHAGLKDWQAETQQTITIEQGPAQSLESPQYQLEYLGTTAQPLEPSALEGNRFEVVVRDLSDDQAQRIVDEFGSLSLGVPNYFDDQRFGSLGFSGEFVAQRWCQGEFERALWLALADRNPHDSADESRQKAILRELWGDFPTAKERLDRSNRRSLVTFLVDRPGDFRGALARLPKPQRGLYVSAFQSHIWNRLLARWIEAHSRPEDRRGLALQLGVVPRPVDFDQPGRLAWLGLRLPLVGTHIRHDSPEIVAWCHEILAEYQLEPRRLRLKGVDDTFFGKGQRPAALMPGERTAQQAPDTRYPGRTAVTLGFTLPPGGYATLVLKCLGWKAPPSWDEATNSASE